MQNNKIIIIGAGPGGLTLAQGLKKAGLPFHVYERDPTADFRAQGYRVRIHPEYAQCLKTHLPAELFDLFEKTCAEMAYGFSKFNALDCTPLPGGPGGPGGPRPGGPGGPGGPMGNGNGEKSYTVDRTTVRNVLLMGLEENVTFGKEYERYEESAEGVKVYFKDGSVEEGGLLVGADGVRSRVRRQYLPENVLVDTEGRAIYGKTVITEELMKRIPEQTTKGISLILDKRYEVPLSLFYEVIRFPNDHAAISNGKVPNVKDYVYWVLFSRKSTFKTEDDKFWKLSKEEAVKLSLKYTEDWDPAFKAILELQDKEQTAGINISSALPDIPFWTPSCVTLLGDAIHVMSPTGAVGANTALKDAATLCETLVEGGVNAESVEKYEEKMRVYAKKSLEMSLQGGKNLFNHPPFEECKPLDF